MQRIFRYIFVVFLLFQQCIAMDADRNRLGRHALLGRVQSDQMLDDLKTKLVGARFSPEQLAVLHPELRNCISESSMLSPMQEKENADAQKAVEELIGLIDRNDDKILTQFLTDLINSPRYAVGLKRAILVLGLSHALAHENSCVGKLFEYVQRTRGCPFRGTLEPRNVVLVLSLESPCSEDIRDCLMANNTILVVDTRVPNDSAGRKVFTDFQSHVRELLVQNKFVMFSQGPCTFFVPKDMACEFWPATHEPFITCYGADVLAISHMLGTILDDRHCWNIEIVWHGNDDKLGEISWSIVRTMLHLMEQVPVHALIFKSCGPVKQLLAQDQFNFPIIIGNSTGCTQAQDFDNFSVEEYPSVTEYALSEIGSLPENVFCDPTVEHKEQIFKAATFSLSPVGAPLIKPAHSLAAYLLEGYNERTFALAYTPCAYSQRVGDLVAQMTTDERTNLQTCTVLLDTPRINPSEITMIWPLTMSSCCAEKKHLFGKLVLKDTGGWTEFPGLDSAGENTTIRSFLWLFIDKADLIIPKTILVDELVLQQENGDFYSLDHVLVRTSVDGDLEKHTMSWHVDSGCYTCQLHNVGNLSVMQLIDQCVTRRMNKRESADYLREYDRERAYFSDK